MRLLGIETSCDETAAAIVERDEAGGGTILSNVVRSQLTEHAPYGGVVPELAARAHVSHLDHMIARASTEAGVALRDLDGIAAETGAVGRITPGPGELQAQHRGVEHDAALQVLHLQDRGDGAECRFSHTTSRRKKGARR